MDLSEPIRQGLATQISPSNTSHMRELLFVLPMTFSLNLANYKLFWPLVDNIYSIRTSRPYTSGSGDYKYHYVICRFKRAYQVIPSFSQGHVLQLSESDDRVALSFKLLKYTNHVEFYLIKTSASVHDHSLDESDVHTLI